MIGWLLGAWTLASWGWWGLAWILLRRGVGPAEEAAPGVSGKLTIFKPVPQGRFKELAVDLETWARETAAAGGTAEMLLGVYAEDEAAALEWAGRWKGGVAVVPRGSQPDWPNRKVAGLRRLAEHATGAFWLWSDADTRVAEGFLASVRRDVAKGTVTYPYRIVEAGSAGWLDALFVAAEFAPGVFLLARHGDDLGAAFGAGIGFSAQDFRRSVRWENLGCEIADDFALGRALKPVRLGKRWVETRPAAADWPGAWRHYRRWHKTVRWCRPLGYAGQLLILPLAGWLVAAVWWPWCAAGAVAMGVLESAAGWALLGAAGSLGRRGSAGLWPVLLAWPWLRLAAWCLAWAPGPVDWNGQKWWQSRDNNSKQGRR